MSLGKLSILLSFFVMFSGCTGTHTATLKSLNDRGLDIEKTSVDAGSREKIMKSYQQFLNEAPANHPMYSSALSRLADLEVISADDKLFAEKEQQYQEVFDIVSKQDEKQTIQSYEAAIKLYEGLLIANPRDPRNDKVLYQLARAYEQNADIEKAFGILSRLVKQFPESQYYIEAQFRRGETGFLLEKYPIAEHAYKAVLNFGPKNIFYQRALYKYGWSLFKQERYQAALKQFFQLMNTMPVVFGRQGQIDFQSLSKVDKDLVEDVFRAINLCFSYAGNAEYVSAYFDGFTTLPFEYEVFNRLGDYLLEKDRIKDAADTYGAFVLRKPFHPMAASLQMKRIAAFDKGKFNNSAMKARQSFIENFGGGSKYWARQSEENRQLLSPLFKQTLTELTEFYHARLQKTKRPVYYISAIKWYQRYTKMFPGDSDTAKMEFMLGELYADHRKYLEAAGAYERAAYSYPPHRYSHEAAYAVIDIYNRLISNASENEKNQWRQKRIEASVRYLQDYSDDRNSKMVKMQLAEEMFAFKRYSEVSPLAQQIVADGEATPRDKSSAMIILGHIAFESRDYLMAQSQYQNAMALGTVDAKLKQSVQERLLAATFKYAEVLRGNQQFDDAANQFLAANRLSPNSSSGINAQYDAATIYINLEKWQPAIDLLLDFRKKYPQHKFQSGVTEKLAVAYEKSGQNYLAAQEMLTISEQNSQTDLKLSALWHAAELFEQHDHSDSAITTYKKLVRSLPVSSEQGFEVRQKLVEQYVKSSQLEKRDYWLRDIVKSYKNTKENLTDRSKYIVASASIVLANEKMEDYKNIKLKLPLKKSMRQKKRSMQNTLTAFESVNNIGVAEFATASTFQVAEVYKQLGEAIMNSQRPKKLSAEELAEYDLQLEEQAFPFEEKAIEVHEINVSRIRDGIYDDWVKRSMDKLALLQPVRYGKVEQREEVYSALD